LNNITAGTIGAFSSAWGIYDINSSFHEHDPVQKDKLLKSGAIKIAVGVAALAIKIGVGGSSQGELGSLILKNLRVLERLSEPVLFFGGVVELGATLFKNLPAHFTYSAAAKMTYGLALSSLRSAIEASTKEKTVESLGVFFSTMGTLGTVQFFSAVVQVAPRRRQIQMYGSIKMAAALGAGIWLMKIEHFS